MTWTRRKRFSFERKSLVHSEAMTAFSMGLAIGLVLCAFALRHLIN